MGNRFILVSVSIFILSSIFVGYMLADHKRINNNDISATISTNGFRYDLVDLKENKKYMSTEDKERLSKYGTRNCIILMRDEKKVKGELLRTIGDELEPYELENIVMFLKDFCTKNIQN